MNILIKRNTISGMELFFFNISDFLWLKTGLKYNKFVINEIIKWKKIAIQVVGWIKENHNPELHLKLTLTYKFPSLQSKIVMNKKNICPKNVIDKNGKKCFSIEIGHKILFFLYLLLIIIIINIINIIDEENIININNIITIKYK